MGCEMDEYCNEGSLPNMCANRKGSMGSCHASRQCLVLEFGNRGYLAGPNGEGVCTGGLCKRCKTSNNHEGCDNGYYCNTWGKNQCKECTGRRRRKSNCARGKPSKNACQSSKSRADCER